MGQEISQQQNQPHQQHQQHQQQTPHHKRQPQRKSFSGISTTNQPIYTPTSHLSTSSSTTNDYSTTNNTNNTNNQNYRLRHKYNFGKQTYERSKIPGSGAGTSQSDTDSHYAKLNLQRSSSQSSDSGIYNSSCHCSSISSISAVSSSASSSRSSSSSSRGCPSSLVSSKSNRSLDKQKHYLSHHLYIKSYLDILEEDERARAHFKSARPGGIRNYTPKILASGESSITGNSSSNTNTTASSAAGLSSSAPAHCYGPGRRSSTSGGGVGGSGSGPGGAGSGATGAGKHCQEDPWI
ncbi:GATA zinc finger domain-containing protein 7-like isoform X1 [Drosophila subpulchrella]|uniref:GATA zinc finger domain-containing protein 7-like isoform X1 n=1 Tax=Drosophila subpulchrella TaxID=1486046 RepID=UPI0018A16D89|nr:GATA zinc finger domain-containing protein 7-like isoform X1 [Drosophila subpulchrella]